mmetsp:Transcript_12987/g.25456  ORF Transcript_12987/g.25456 Transcript_12987/m.25456 type:complete len:819 (-) Transcript_12987:91-2547(-)
MAEVVRIDILSDSPFDIWRIRATEAYGGRELVDDWEMPGNISLDRVLNNNADAHIDLTPDMPIDPDYDDKTIEYQTKDGKRKLKTAEVDLSEIPGRCRPTPKGVNRSSHTKSPFEYPAGKPYVGGYFQTALENFGKAVCIGENSGVDMKEFRKWFTAEWGIQNSQLLENFIPRLRNPDNIQYGGLYENRHPGIFAHQNASGYSRFKWHNVTNKILTSRIGRHASYDFAKGRSFGEWLLRVMHYESEVEIDREVRLNYQVRASSIPSPFSTLVVSNFPPPKPPEGRVLDSVRRAEQVLVRHQYRHVEVVKVRASKIGILTVPENKFFVEAEENLDPPVFQPKLNLSSAEMSRRMKQVSFETMGDPFASKESKFRKLAASNHFFRVDASELKYIVNAFLPLGTLPRAHFDVYDKHSSPAAIALLQKLNTDCFVQRVYELARCVFGKHNRAVKFQRAALFQLGFKPRDFHHAKGREIFKRAIERKDVRYQLLNMLRGVKKLRTSEIRTVQYTTHRIWRLWAIEGNLFLALSKVMKEQIKKWKQEYLGRSRYAETKKETITYQQRAKLLDTLKFHYDFEGPIKLQIDTNLLRRTVARTLANFTDKRKTKKEITPKEMHRRNILTNAYEADMKNMLEREIFKYWGMKVNDEELIVEVEKLTYESIESIEGDFNQFLEDARNSFLKREIDRKWTMRVEEEKKLSDILKQKIETLDKQKEDEIRDTMEKEKEVKKQATSKATIFMKMGNKPLPKSQKDKVFPIAEVIDDLLDEGFPARRLNWVRSSFPGGVTNLQFLEIIRLLSTGEDFLGDNTTAVEKVLKLAK